RLYEGTNEINRLVIATRLLRRKHHPAEDPHKRLLCALMIAAQRAWGESLPEQQEVLAHLADIAIEIYAVESATLRMRKRGGPADIVEVYAADAADRIEHSARQVIAATGHARPRSLAPARDDIDPIAARRRIADAVIKAGRYIW
ncbi:MAG TPA: hypothetical protein VF980_05340, partial [Thermoanaerobaculia bacterium]